MSNDFNLAEYFDELRTADYHALYNDSNAGRFIHVGGANASIVIGAVKRMAEHTMRCPIPGLKDDLFPLVPGDVALILGQTHNGKSKLLNWWQDQEADRVRGTKNLVYGVNLEDATENADIKLLSDVVAGFDPVRIARGQDKLSRGMIGELADGLKAHQNRNRIKISLPSIHASSYIKLGVTEIAKLIILASHPVFLQETYGCTDMMPIGLFVDYFQAIPPDPNLREQVGYGKDPRMNAIHNYEALFVTAKELSIPMVMAAQSPRNIDAKQEFYVPAMFDVAESIYPAQRGPIIISIGMPKTNNKFDIGEDVEFKRNGKYYAYTVREDTMLMALQKQRKEGARSGIRYFMQWDYFTNELHQTQPRQIEKDNGKSKFENAF